MIKYPDCPQCLNKGTFLQYRVDTPERVAKVYCDCEYGKEVQVVDNQASHPEYENPFKSMTDYELIQTLSYFADNQKAIDAEFYL